MTTEWPPYWPSTTATKHTSPPASPRTALAHASVARFMLERGRAPVTYRRWLLLGLGLSILVALLLSSGCSSTEAKAILVIRQGRVLLRTPLPDDEEWQVRRVQFLENAEDLDPVAKEGE